MNKSAVKNTAAILLEVKWLNRVNQFDAKDIEFSSKIERCPSWDSAIKEVMDRNWRNIKLEALNQTSSFLDAKFRKEYQSWNNVVDEIDIVVDQIFTQNPIHLDATLPMENLKKIVRSDITRVLIESAWSDYLEPKFFAAIGFVYVKGHFPCGWRGVFPDGKLFVY
ncbi:MAG: hypothetical protein HC933_09980 [Pleurocapsa sp. SU_196_0]|nr:hypothetical protein [Pleurocapsa sp. SU_196_0]